MSCTGDPWRKRRRWRSATIVDAVMSLEARCTWCLSTPAYIRYHDEEWGKPQHDDRVLFEFLILEGAQAGLSWLTVLNKRDGYRKAFADFDAQKVARFTDAKLEKLMLDPGIVRNRLKIFSARTNAQAFLKVQKEFGSFDVYLWDHVGGKPLINKVRAMGDVPVKTELSEDRKSTRLNSSH